MILAPSALRPGLDPQLEAICLRCLELEPARRYAGAGELAEALAGYQEGGSGRRPGATLAVLAGGALLATARAPGSPSLVSLEPATLVCSLLLFAVRDLGLLVLLNLAPNPRRADLAWLIYLSVLYLLAPALALAAGIGGASAWLLPRADLGLAAGTLPVLAQAALVVMAVALRWRRGEASTS